MRPKEQVVQSSVFDTSLSLSLAAPSPLPPLLGLLVLALGTSSTMFEAAPLAPIASLTTEILPVTLLVLALLVVPLALALPLVVGTTSSSIEVLVAELVALPLPLPLPFPLPLAMAIPPLVAVVAIGAGILFMCSSTKALLGSGPFLRL